MDPDPTRSATELGVACWFLVPRTRDEKHGGGRHDEAALRWLTESLDRISGGWSRHERVEAVLGRWQREDGTPVMDASLRIELGLNAEQREELAKLLPQVAVRFGQDCIYAVLAEQQAVLIWRTEP